MSSNSLIKVLSQCEISPAFIADLDIHPLLGVEHGPLHGVVPLVLIDVLVQLLHPNDCIASIAGWHQVNAE